MTVIIEAACEHGVAIARTDDMVYPLTPCHRASGKGSEVESGTVCRACYEEVDPIYGDCVVIGHPEEAAAWFAVLGCPDPHACAAATFSALVVRA